MSEVSIINKIKEFFSIRKSQKAGKDEAGLKSQGNGSNFVGATRMAARKAEGRIIRPIEPAFRRNYNE